MTSGSCTTTAREGRSLTFSWERVSYSAVDNTSKIHWTLYGSGSYSGYIGVKNIDVIINGVTKLSTGYGTEYTVYPNTLVASGNVTVNHDNDGNANLSVTVKAGIYVYSVQQVGSGRWALDQIQRYPTVTQELSSKTETTVTMNWATDKVVDALWYSEDGGDNWTAVVISEGTGGSYTINTSPNTTLNIITKARCKDSQLSAESSELEVTSFRSPYALSLPSFIIGDQVIINLYNPLGRTVAVEMLDESDNTLATVTADGVSAIGFNGPTVVNVLYGLIPNSRSGAYKIRVTYDTTQVTVTTGGVFSVNVSVCSPSVQVVSYNDINSSVIAITGDNTKIVRNQSIVRYSASGLVGNRGASISSVSVTVNSNTYNLTISGSSASGGDAVINSGSSVEAVFTITDSRGISVNVSVSVDILDWQLPSAIISLARQYNYYSLTYITVDVDYSYIEGNNAITITYKARKKGTSPWTVNGSLSDNVQSSFTADNEYEWEVQVILVDSFGGTTTYNMVLSRGMPIAFFDRLKSSVGVNCFPVNEGSLEVNGYDITAHDGEVMSLAGQSQTDVMVVNGILTDSGARVIFSVMLPKFVSGLSIAVTDLALNIWQADGGFVLASQYTNNGYDVLNDNTITVTATLVAGNVVTIVLDKTTAFNGTNNSPVAVMVNSIELTFS